MAGSQTPERRIFSISSFFLTMKSLATKYLAIMKTQVMQAQILQIQFIVAVLLITLCSAAFPTLGVAQPVIKQTSQSGSLDSRMEDAMSSIDRNTKRFWVGYNISKFMRETAWIGKIGGEGWAQRKSLNEWLGIEYAGPDVPEELEKNLHFKGSGTFHIRMNGDDGELHLKEIAVLVLYRAQGAKRQPVEIYVTDMALRAALDRNPVYWLGKASDEESTAYLRGMYDASTTRDLKEDVLRAISLHENRAENFDFFAGILNNESSSDLREEAAFWVGQMDLPRGLTLLKQAIANDRSDDVREKAVFAISEMSIDAAQDVLIDLARNSRDAEVREKAIFWLGQKASKKATKALEEMVYDDDDTKVQEHAVFALSQLPADESIPRLIEIAKNHPSAPVRKKAIFWLGDSGDPRAVEVLVDLVKSAN